MGRTPTSPSIRRQAKRRVARRPRRLCPRRAPHVADASEHPRWLTECDILFEVVRQVSGRVRPPTAGDHVERALSHLRTSSSPTVLAWASISPGPPNVTTPAQVVGGPVSARPAIGPGTPSAVASRCATHIVACGFVRRTTSAPGVRLTPRASANVGSDGASGTRSCCSLSGAGGGRASRPSRYPCRLRTPIILCSTRPGRCCTDWASAVMRTWSRSAIRAGRMPARRWSSPSSRGAIRWTLLARSWPPKIVTLRAQSRFGTSISSPWRADPPARQDFGVTLRGSMNGIAAVVAGQRLPSGASISSSVPGFESPNGTQT